MQSRPPRRRDRVEVALLNAVACIAVVAIFMAVTDVALDIRRVSAPVAIVVQTVGAYRGGPGTAFEHSGADMRISIVAVVATGSRGVAVSVTVDQVAGAGAGVLADVVFSARVVVVAVDPGRENIDAPPLARIDGADVVVVAGHSILIGLAVTVIILGVARLVGSGINVGVIVVAIISPGAGCSIVAVAVDIAITLANPVNTGHSRITNGTAHTAVVRVIR
jgi:hypothetical protein